MQNFSSFQAKIKLSADGKELLIINRKPVEKLQHVLEADPKLVDQEKLKILNAKRKEDESVGLDHCPSELDESMDQVEF